jgi:predicted phosphodiesterase
LTTRIGLLSDVHATPGPVREALAILRGEGASAIFCLGDIAGYGDALEATIALLEEAGCRSILGNHDIWYLQRNAGRTEDPLRGFFTRLPLVLAPVIEGCRLYLVHASPPSSCMDGIRLLDEHGRMIGRQREAWSRRLTGFAHDVLLVGHTHQVFAERLADTRVINPGSTLFNHACAILTLPGMDVEVYGLSGSAPQAAWRGGKGGVFPPSR